MAFEPGKVTLICGRAGDPEVDPAPGSGVGTCSACGHAVVVSPLSRLRHEVEGLAIACLECLVRHRKAGHPVIVRPPRHRRETGRTPPAGEGDAGPAAAGDGGQ